MKKASYNKSFTLFRVSPLIFDQFKEFYMTSIEMNDKLTEEERKKLIKNINDVKFEKKFLDLHLNTHEPVFDEYLGLKFELKDLKGNDIKLSTYVVGIKHKITTTTHGAFYGEMTSYMYEYNWMIEFEKPINYENYGKENFPLTFNIIFPNGDKIEYLVNYR